MPQRLTESQTLTLTENTPGSGGRLQIGLITPGWGSSGYYSSKVLENAANDRVFPKGTKMFLDHASESERRDRPERSVRDLAAVLTEDARWDGNGLVAEAKVIGPYRDLLTDPTVAENIGVSIAAYAETTAGEAEGRQGTIVTNLTEAFSVDFVTFPGRGGAVLSVLESARAEAREATTADARDRLDRAAATLYGDAYVEDFDPDQHVAWVRTWDDNDPGLWQHTYELTDNAATLSTDRSPVRRVTTYLPLDGTTDALEASPNPPVAPAGSTPTHESPKEDTMPQIEESRLAQLEADAGRVHEAEQARDQADARATALEAELRTVRNDAAATKVLAESGHTFTALERRGLMADLPVTEDGDLDIDAFTQAVETAAADSQRRAGNGTVTGFGATTEETTTTVSESDLNSALARAFNRKEA